MNPHISYEGFIMALTKTMLATALLLGVTAGARAEAPTPAQVQSVERYLLSNSIYLRNHCPDHRSDDEALMRFILAHDSDYDPNDEQLWATIKTRLANMNGEPHSAHAHLCATAAKAMTQAGALIR